MLRGPQCEELGGLWHDIRVRQDPSQWPFPTSPVHPAQQPPSGMDPREEKWEGRQVNWGSRRTSHHLWFLQLGLGSRWLIGGRSFQSAGSGVGVRSREVSAQPPSPPQSGHLLDQRQKAVFLPVVFSTIPAPTPVLGGSQTE